MTWIVQFEEDFEREFDSLPMEAIRAMGDELQLVVKFPDRPSIRLSGFQDLAESSLDSVSE